MPEIMIFDEIGSKYTGGEYIFKPLFYKDIKGEIMKTRGSMLFFGARMGLIIDFCQMLKVERGIHLRCGNRAVSQHFLYRA